VADHEFCRSAADLAPLGMLKDGSHISLKR
jgi:hypothetical protein